MKDLAFRQKLSRFISVCVSVLTMVCCLTLASCSSDDDPAVEPTTELLQDGVWTGSGEGRSGTIVVKMTVENHEISDIVVNGKIAGRGAAMICQ